MNNNIEATAALIHSLAAIIAFLLAWQFIYVPTIVEYFRQDVFEQRRSFFLFMADGKIMYDHPAYMHIRKTMNGLIYHAETITLARVIFAWFLFRKEGRIQTANFMTAVESIEEESTREALLEYRKNVGLSILRKMILTSPITMLMIAIVGIIAIVVGFAVGIFRRITKLRTMLAEPIESIEAEARTWTIDSSKEFVLGGA